MFAEKLKFFQGYVRVRLTGYAPERFLNLCSNRNILIWNLEYREEHYEFCISVRGFRQLKPLLRKTKTRLIILQRYGLPFWLHRYRKRKLFFGGIFFCGAALYVLSLFIWNIQIQGNQHQTDSTILKFLEENEVYHGIPKSRLDCAALEELLRSQYEDVIWASVKIQGTRLIIDIQENLATNQTAEPAEDAAGETAPSDLVAEKDAEIFQIFTRKGTPHVEKGSQVAAGDLLVEGRLPIYNDAGEIVNYQYCSSDADILGTTVYEYEDHFSLDYQDKVFTGATKKSWQISFFQKQIRLPFGNHHFRYCDKVTSELPLKIGESFYLPIVLYREEAKEYVLKEKTYTESEAKALAENKLAEFCKKLEQKGVQIIENNVIIVVEGKTCRASGSLKVIEPIGRRQKTEIQQEGQMENESDRTDNQYTN